MPERFDDYLTRNNIPFTLVNDRRVDVEPITFVWDIFKCGQTFPQSETLTQHHFWLMFNDDLSVEAEVKKMAKASARCLLGTAGPVTRQTEAPK